MSRLVVHQYFSVSKSMCMNFVLYSVYVVESEPTDKLAIFVRAFDKNLKIVEKLICPPSKRLQRLSICTLLCEVP